MRLFLHHEPRRGEVSFFLFSKRDTVTLAVGSPRGGGTCLKEFRVSVLDFLTSCGSIFEGVYYLCSTNHEGWGNTCLIALPISALGGHGGGVTVLRSDLISALENPRGGIAFFESGN